MLLELRGIQKSYGGVTALRRGDLEVERGEVHLLLGENGAGKSTLMKIVAGMTTRDAGEFLWQGKPVHFTRPADAARMGIAMVHQESLLAPHLSVAENIFLGREERLPFGYVSPRRMREDATRLIEEHQFPLQADWKVGRLNPAGKQLVEICRALQHGSSLLIFDEPTSSLSETETEEVFRIVAGLRERGLGVIYITHRLEELRRLGDKVTVLRDGETVFSGPLAEVSTEEIIQFMVGRPVTSIYARKPLPPGETLLEVKGLSRPPVLRNISFQVRAGEIVGLSGLVGAGRTELCRALFGLDRIAQGVIKVAGQAMVIHSPRDAVRAGLALIPEDRQRAGLALGLPVLFNITMAHLKEFSPGGIIRRAQEKRAAEELVAKLKIRVSSLWQPAGRLSGGNQQKVVISKWLVKRARVFLFDEPTRGIDVGAKVEVFDVMDRLAREGAAVLMVSSELQELQQMADRILVMREGEISGELPHGATQEELMRLAALKREHPLRNKENRAI